MLRIGVLELLRRRADLGSAKVGVEELFVVGEGDGAEESGEHCMRSRVKCKMRNGKLGEFGQRFCDSLVKIEDKAIRRIHTYLDEERNNLACGIMIPSILADCWLNCAIIRIPNGSREWKRMGTKTYIVRLHHDQDGHEQPGPRYQTSARVNQQP